MARLRGDTKGRLFASAKVLATHIGAWKYNDQPEVDWPQVQARLAADKIAARRNRAAGLPRAYVDGNVPGGRSENVAPSPSQE